MLYQFDSSESFKQTVIHLGILQRNGYYSVILIQQIVAKSNCDCFKGDHFKSLHTWYTVFQERVPFEVKRRQALVPYVRI